MKKAFALIFPVLCFVAQAQILIAADNGTEFFLEDDLTVFGTGGTATDPDLEAKGFSVFGATQAAYIGVSVGPGNIVVNGVISVSSGAYFAGSSTFTAAQNIFVNDGAVGQLLQKSAPGNLTWASPASLGDGLGGHVATMTLSMQGFPVLDASTVNARSIAVGEGVMVGAQISALIRPPSPNYDYLVYVTTGFYPDAPSMVVSSTGYVGLGTASPAEKLHINGGGIRASGSVSAAAYQIAGSTVLAILPGGNSLGVGDGAGRANAGAYNSFIGSWAGYNNTTGQGNSFVGAFAGNSNTTGVKNSFMGHQSGSQNTTGEFNTFLGGGAGLNNITGTNNTFVGYSAGITNKSGSANAIFGAEAGNGTVDNSFSSSTLVGYRTGYGLSTGSDNIFLGFQAGYSVTTGTGNIVVGYSQNTSAPAANNELNIGGVLYGNLAAGTIGVSTRMPQAALDIVSTGTATNIYAQIWRNAAGAVVASMTSTGLYQGNGSGLTGVVATDSSKVAKTGDSMTGQLTASSITATSALGVSADKLWFNPNVEISSATAAYRGGVYVSSHVYFAAGSNIYNISTITAAGNISAARYQINGSTVLSVLSGTGSLGVGDGAGRISIGIRNTAVGSGAGYSNTTASDNTFVGHQAGYNTTVGGQNNFIGYWAGYSNLTGTNNTFIGMQAGLSNTMGTYNVFLGNQAGQNNIAGFNNSFLGVYAGNKNTTGTNNSFVGYQAGQNNLTGSANAILGNEAGSGVLDNSFSSSTLIGYQAGFNLVAGSADNIFLGYQAGYDVTTGTGNIVIGYNQDTRNPAANNQLNIGGVIFGDLSARTIGISTRVPQAALDVVSTGTLASQYAQIWRNSAGTAVASMTATGRLSGDGSGLWNVAATDLTKVSKTGDSMTGQYTVQVGTFTLTDEDMFFSVRGDGSIISTGVYAAGSPLPTSGPGVRFMWYPSLAAIRAGGVSSNQWDSSNIGAFSVAFGYNTVANGSYASVVGGYGNQAIGQMPFAGGGEGNRATADYTVATGGRYNVVSGSNSVIAGGAYNLAQGTSAVVAGGENNQASGKYSGVLGGNGNRAQGFYSAVPGGAHNSAAGAYSFASGYQSTAAANGTFAWKDSQPDSIVNDIPDQVMFKARGGFWVSTGTVYGAPGLYVSTNNNVTIGMAAALPARLTIIEPNPQLYSGNSYLLKVGTNVAGDMLSVSTAGIVSMDRQSVVIASMSATMTALPPTTWSIITFNAIIRNTQNELIGTDFIAKTPGRYLVTFIGHFYAGTGGARGIGIALNDEIVPEKMATATWVSGLPTALSLSHVFSLQAGEELRFKFYTAEGTAMLDPFVTITKIN
ncbi:MAG TPA: hypothetical protein DCS63_02340 [Elusimicrobia bacterium]|nr:hypothetical protein [Elusimicrobiota bacterium]